MKIADLPGKESKRYIKALQSFEPNRQLLIKVGGGLLEDETAVLELVEALSELTGRGIHIVLVHGGGLQLTAALKSSGLKPQFIEGKRFTDETTLNLAKVTFEAVGDSLVRKFSGAGVDAIAIPSTQLLVAKQNPKFGLVGTEISSVDATSIINATKQHHVVVIGLLARDEATGQTLNVNGDTVFRALATELKSHRMVSLTPTGGVFGPVKGTNTRELLSGIDVQNVDALIDDGIVSGGMALKLRELASVLDGLEIGSAISITKPSELLVELLTDRGSGTFVCRGQKIIRAHNLDGLFDDLSTLIAETFNKSLPEGYQDQKFAKIYFTGDHLAFGIVTKLSDGTPYLDKLAVSPQLQGRGVGESLWYCVAKDYPKIVWRSHVNNRYATWYHRHADIMKRSGEWILFGKGVDFAELEALEQELVSVPQMR